MDHQKLKDKASDAFAKGKFSRAAELYAEYCAADPKDRQARLRMGDAWAKAGNRDKAISAYRSAAEAFAKEGFLPRAIAASKLILELDPAHQDIQRMLANLYAQKSSIQRKPTGPIGPVPSTNQQDAVSTEQPSTDVAVAATTTSDQTPSKAVDIWAGEPTVLNPPATASEQAPSKAVDIWAGEPSVLSPPAAASSQRPPVAAAPAEGKTSVLSAAPAASNQKPPAGAAIAEGETSVVSAAPAASNQKAPTVIPIAPGETSQPSAAPPASKDEPTLVYGKREGEPSVLSAPAAASSQKPPSSAAIAKDRPSVLSPPAAASNREPSIDVAVRDAAASALHPPAASDGETLSDVLMTMVGEPEAALPPTAAAAQKTASSNRSTGAFSFTELELEEGSLLHAVEAAATEGPGKQPVLQQNAPEANPAEAAEERVAEPLPQIPLFSDLPPDAFVQLFERCPLRGFAMGEEIIAQGTIGHCFYVICAGSVAVFRLQDGKRTQITTLPEGSFFGEMALLSGSPRAASVESASEETQLLEISTSVLSELSQRYPTVARALRKFYRQRLLTNVMKTSRLFQPFNKADRGELVRRFRWRDVRKGEVIVREGAETDGLYVVLSGEVEVRKGNQTVLANLKEGDLFGEISLLTKTPATATVTATRRTSLLCLPRADFDALILGHPQVLMLVSELTDERQGKAQATLSPPPQQSLMI